MELLGAAGFVRLIVLGGPRLFQVSATAASRLASAAARERSSSNVGETGSMIASTVSPARTSAPALNGMRRSWPATGVLGVLTCFAACVPILIVVGILWALLEMLGK